MGIGGNFWDLLKPYARPEGFDFLRNKRVAVDLSYWIVQHETALKGNNVLNPHIRLTFFRTVNLFSTFGAYPVFVTDGTPSPLKSQARILRFLRASGIDTSSLPAVDKGISVERNKAFQKCVLECVELLKLLGMPVLNAKGEAEALCAQLNREGHVDACVTADSDVFLFGAKCVIKHIQPNSKEPFECYYMSDIEAGLGLRRKQLIAISLLVGNDHNLSGVPGIGLETAQQFAKSFSEDEILDRLREISRGKPMELNGIASPKGDMVLRSDESPQKRKCSHCSFCGHPGSKRGHLKSACEYCSIGEGCKPKPPGFKCSCSSCDMGRKEKEQKKNENWHINVCRKIALDQDIPHDSIMKMYLHNDNRVDDGSSISWTSPQTDTLVDYLAYYQHWDPSYTRQRMLPMLSTLLLRDVASNSENLLLCGQYEFDSIKRVKMRYGHQFYVVNWKKVMNTMLADTHTVTSERLSLHQETDEVIDLTKDPDGLEIDTKKTGNTDKVDFAKNPNLQQENLAEDHDVLVENHIEETDEVIDLTKDPDGLEVDTKKTGNTNKVDFTEEPGKAMHSMADDICMSASENLDLEQESLTEDRDVLVENLIEETGKDDDDIIDLTEEPVGPEIHIENGCCYLCTDEDMELVRKAFPEKVNDFLEQKELKEMTKSQRKRRLESSGSSMGTQRNITEFFRSSKGTSQAKPGEASAGSSSSCGNFTKEQKEQVPKFSKSVRRRLLFG